MPYFETSAYSSTNVEKSVDCLLDLVMQRIQQSVKQTWMPFGDSKGIILDADTASSYCSYCWSYHSSRNLSFLHLSSFISFYSFIYLFVHIYIYIQILIHFPFFPVCNDFEQMVTFIHVNKMNEPILEFLRFLWIYIRLRE